MLNLNRKCRSVAFKGHEIELVKKNARVSTRFDDDCSYLFVYKINYKLINLKIVFIRKNFVCSYSATYSIRFLVWI